MDAFKNLPAPARIGIPLLLVLAVGAIAWMTMFSAPKQVELIKTQDVGLYTTAKTVLDSKTIGYDEVRLADSFILTVPADDSSRAAETLAKSGIKDRTGLAKTIKCPAAPGFTATRSANERAANCDDALAVQGMLLTAGAIAANVRVSQETTGTRLGPEKVKNVVAQVFLPADMIDNWPADEAAQHLSRAVGTSIDRVSISDGRLNTLFNGAANTSAGTTGGTATRLGGLGCGDIAGATEIETKKAAVRSCYKGTIGEELTELLGGSDRFVLTVEPTIQSAATTTTTVRNTAGPVVGKSTQAGGGSRAAEVTSPPNTSESTKVVPAGAISSMRITATLDKSLVTQDQVLAVKRVLSAYVDAKRGDPAPTVTMSRFADGSGKAPTNDDFAKLQEQTAKAEADPLADALAGGPTAPQVAVPTWAKALMAVLAVAMVTAILLLWRRSVAISAERARLEQSFQREQRLFEDFAQQNPDHLARDLNALFGAPSAPEPTYRS